MADIKKKAREQKAWLVFQDESGVSQRPSIRRTWAPKGQTPLLTHRFNWQRLSLAAALAYRWDGRKSKIFFQMQPGSYNDLRLIGFLRGLRRELRGQKVFLIWDGLPSHKSRRMRQYLEGQSHWLQVTRLPSYAPDLNPVEQVWTNLKGQELANRCPDGLEELGIAARQGFRRLRRHKKLPWSFLRHTQLFF
jgi:transposase